MLRVYVAGAYSSDNVMGVLENMRKGIRLSTEVLLEGMAPFCPWLDFHYTLTCRDGEKVSLDTYYRYSLAWLMASDAVVLVDGWEVSKGTKAEILKASEIGIPVFKSIQELVQWKEERLARVI